MVLLPAPITFRAGEEVLVEMEAGAAGPTADQCLVGLVERITRV